MPLDKQTREAILKLKQTNAGKAKRIREDKRNSTEGIRRKLAVLDAQERAAISALWQDGSRRHAAAVDKYSRHMFGIQPGDGDPIQAAKELRACTERANAINSVADAEQLAAAARRLGDTLLERAIFARAWDLCKTDLGAQKWGGIVRSYLDRNPQVRPVAQQLGDLLDADTAQARMQDQIICGRSRAPELSLLTDQEIDLIAAEETQGGAA
ncbi:hypothetical protein [Nonomuraea jiangxiensis]|uniref:Uncharacterized protein n=1 Tax=Nonomuraea jiangxiensis TaxID=633440 RepID=A0A1G8XTN6_9ACTN|nr:hypothetical protein [Nonomuraea jiangxiensis]SDJ93888.1 hypothetical protein SAMN05421869_11372 [Nonomuraea jiangxiensis]